MLMWIIYKMNSFLRKQIYNKIFLIYYTKYNILSNKILKLLKYFIKFKNIRNLY